MDVDDDGGLDGGSATLLICGDKFGEARLLVGELGREGCLSALRSGNGAPKDDILL